MSMHIILIVSNKGVISYVLALNTRIKLKNNKAFFYSELHYNFFQILALIKIIQPYSIL